MDYRQAATNFSLLVDTVELSYMTAAMHPGYDHTFKVRIADINGYPSSFTQMEAVLSPNPGRCTTGGARSP